MATSRSPMYPQRSLAEAVKFVEAIYNSEKTHPASEEALVQAIGYTTLSGKSRSSLAALKRYGLLEKTQDGFHRLSSLAMKILFPVQSGDRKAALKAAFLEPSVFLEMFNRFGEELPSMTTMRNYLMSIGFVDTGAQELADNYKESLEFLELEGVRVSVQREEIREDQDKETEMKKAQLEADEIIDEDRRLLPSLRALPEAQPVIEDMVVRVSKNAHVHVRFAGEYSKRSIDILIDYLKVMQRTFESDVEADN